MKKFADVIKNTTALLLLVPALIIAVAGIWAALAGVLPGLNGDGSSDPTPTSTAGATATPPPTPTPPAPTSRAPTVGSLDCSPAEPEVGETVACKATIKGLVVSYEWSAPTSTIGVKRWPENGNEIADPTEPGEVEFSTAFTRLGYGAIVILKACGDEDCQNNAGLNSMTFNVTASPIPTSDLTFALQCQAATPGSGSSEDGAPLVDNRCSVVGSPYWALLKSYTDILEDEVGVELACIGDPTEHEKLLGQLERLNRIDAFGDLSPAPDDRRLKERRPPETSIQVTSWCSRKLRARLKTRRSRLKTMGQWRCSRPSASRCRPLQRVTRRWERLTFLGASPSQKSPSFSISWPHRGGTTPRAP